MPEEMLECSDADIVRMAASMGILDEPDQESK
jgi:hypothetical protein